MLCIIVILPQFFPYQPSIANTTNIDTLLVATPKEEIPEPAEQVQDKVAFVFNNLSQVNLVQKVSAPQIYYTESQKKLITSSGRRSLKSTASKLIIFGHK